VRVARGAAARLPLRVDLRGSRRASVPVTLLVRLADGRTRRVERTFRTCASRGR
ncbi:MAG: hypothetical protein JWO90_114, partial [Solirubrobacterales bacterium]|nr:hypothetical protein [Solirubrobacterales bacterium]